MTLSFLQLVREKLQIFGAITTKYEGRRRGVDGGSLDEAIIILIEAVLDSIISTKTTSILLILVGGITFLPTASLFLSLLLSILIIIE